MTDLSRRGLLQLPAFLALTPTIADVDQVTDYLELIGRSATYSGRCAPTPPDEIRVRLATSCANPNLAVVIGWHLRGGEHKQRFVRPQHDGVAHPFKLTRDAFVDVLTVSVAAREVSNAIDEYVMGLREDSER